MIFKPYQVAIALGARYKRQRNKWQKEIIYGRWNKFRESRVSAEFNRERNCSIREK